MYTLFCYRLIGFISNHKEYTLAIINIYFFHYFGAIGTDQNWSFNPSSGSTSAGGHNPYSATQYSLGKNQLGNNEFFNEHEDYPCTNLIVK